MSLRPVFERILTHAEEDAAGKPAIVSDERVLSYGELGSEVGRRAATLAGRCHVKAGDRVVLLAEPHADFICTYLAVHSLGAVCAPLDPRIAGDRLLDILDRLSPRIVVAENALQPRLRDQVRYNELAGVAASSSVGATKISLDRTADILHTTGTTARSKGVVLSHGALATACRHINLFMGTGGDAVEVLSLPLSHSFGLGRMRCVLALGATLVLVPGFLGASRITNALAAHRATGFASVPAGIAILLHEEGAALSRFADQLEYLEIGSSIMPLEQKLRLLELLPNTRICMHYGLTEASRSAYISFHDDRGKLDSIGRPSPGVEMRIVDASGEPADVGAAGQIEVRGGHLMSGYWEDPALTAETMHDGWLRTGDVGRTDADGCYHLEARVDDVINVGGHKVLPQEIEKILANHPAIAECACIGIPDPQGLSGEIISAWLVPRRADAERPGFAELAKLLRQNLEPFKAPREFHWIDRIPRSSAGKVLRRQLREMK